MKIWIAAVVMVLMICVSALALAEDTEAEYILDSKVHLQWEDISSEEGIEPGLEKGHFTELDKYGLKM